MKTLIVSIVTTNTGWLTRQALKYVSLGSASLAGWLQAQGMTETHTSAIAAGVVAAAAGGLELLLSFVARKYAVK